MNNRQGPQHELFDSIDTMLSGDAIGDILNRKVSHINCQLINTPYGLSGSRIYFIEADDERLVMKRLAPKLDWIAIATEDQLCRSVTIWRYGLLDRLYPYLDHAILAGCRDGDDYAILMRDVSPGILCKHKLTKAEIYRLLGALATMHAIFWESCHLEDPSLGLCDIGKLIKYTFPTMFNEYPHDLLTMERLSRGWEALLNMLAPDVREATLSLIEDPSPLFAELKKHPSTLLHADYKPANLALMADYEPVITLDWQCATNALMTIDLAWFLMDCNVCSYNLPIEDAADYYRLRLIACLGNRFDKKLWRRMLEVGFLIDMLRKGCWHALYAVYKEDDDLKSTMRAAIAVYNDLARQGLKWL